MGMRSADPTIVTLYPVLRWNDYNRATARSRGSFPSRLSVPLIYTYMCNQVLLASGRWEKRDTKGANDNDIRQKGKRQFRRRIKRPINSRLYLPWPFSEARNALRRNRLVHPPPSPLPPFNHQALHLCLHSIVTKKRRKGENKKLGRSSPVKLLCSMLHVSSPYPPTWNCVCNPWTYIRVESGPCLSS